MFSVLISTRKSRLLVFIRMLFIAVSLLIAAHNVYFCGEIRKISIRGGVKTKVSCRAVVFIT